MFKGKLATRLEHIHKSDIRKIFDAAPAGAINLGLGELQFPTPEKIREQAIRLLHNKYIPYTPNAGDRELRDAILQYYGNTDLDVCVTVGAEEALFLAILAFTGKGDEVLIPDPGFVAYKSIVQIAEAEPLTFNLLPEENFRLDLEQLATKITDRTKMIILSNPSNPLGTCLIEEEVEVLVKLCKQHDIILLVDEIYRELFHENKSASWAGRSANCLVVSGISKSHCMTGWRIGWLVGSPAMIEPVIPLHQYICTCAPYLSQKAAIFALSTAGMAAKEEIRKLLYSNYTFLKHLFDQKLGSLEIVEPAASPYLFFRTGRKEEDDIVKLLNAGVIALPGSIFGRQSKDWIRLSYGLGRERLEEAADRIISALKS